MGASGVIFRSRPRRTQSPPNDKETERWECRSVGQWLRGTIFVDAFAGPGLSRVRTKPKTDESPGLFAADAESDRAEIEFLKGSPRVALDLVNPFSAYVFVDNDPKRIAELKALKTEYAATRTIIVQEGDANAALQAWLASGIDWKSHRAVVFLDPFGMQVPWSTVDALAKTKAVEVIVNFPLGMAIQRLLTKSGDIPKGWQISLDSFWFAGLAAACLQRGSRLVWSEAEQGE
jgi:three-Cys-motif partner protein